MHQRIEKSAFHPGQYVGYADGPWNVKKADGLWEARKADGKDFFRASSLEKVGAGLDQRANLAVGKALSR